ncbi:trypsin-like peptidase domain-containing protein [Anaeromyxobacter terrae]|uniref:trypsin-like peptidase domain-containing protein n=1 Tax=Anaeromyxobacter terrae TaxID=2925406 RepID=UPI001F5997AC|nr:serine protease [Anaeromyxobacter sp. SG22]
MHVRAARVLLPLALGVAAAAPAPAADRGAPRVECAGRYADTLSAMKAAAREREARPAADYVYCLRATAVYEQLSYGRGGKLRRQYYTKVRHGTGFAYRLRGDESLLATNHHVVDFPEVTGEGVELEGVPPGSRRVREEIRIVANEAEPDAPAQLALTPVVSDPALDVAVLSAPAKLRTLPYHTGSAADLRVGDAVLVRGFPLGAFPAANAGRVIAVGQRDLDRGWDHEDFAVDALLNLGSSGSPVLAVSCSTGEPELVGIYHAGYRGAQGLNVVIGIDQLRGLLADLRPSPREIAAREPGADPAAARAALARGPIVMPFGGRAVRVEASGGVVRFSLLDASYPLSTRVELAVLDAGPSSGDSELRDALWEQLALVVRYRRAEEGGDGARSELVRARVAERIHRREEEQADLVAATQAGADGLAVIGPPGREPASGGAVRDARGGSSPGERQHPALP